MPFQEDKADLLRKLAAERQALLDSVRDLDDEQAGRPAPGDEWSVKQQLAHVAASERLYNRCVRRALQDDGADTSDLWPRSQEPTDFADARDRALPDLVADVTAARDETIALIEELDENGWGKRGANTPFGDLTVGQFLKSLYRHDRMHIDQIAGRDPAFKPQLRDPNRLRL